MVQEQSKYCQSIMNILVFIRMLKILFAKQLSFIWPPPPLPPQKYQHTPPPSKKVPSTSSSKAPTESIYPSSSP